MTIDAISIEEPRVGGGMMLALLGVSAAALAAGAFVAPQRTWAAVLLAGLALTGIALGALLFVAIEQLTGARWSLGLRPAALRLSRLLVPGSALVAAAVALGGNALFPWIGQREGLPPFRAFWLQPDFHLARTLVYLGAWLALAAAMRRAFGGDAAPLRARRTPVAAAFVVVFAPTITFAAFDWMMALEPHWYSTMFGIYRFAGLFAAALAALILLATVMAARGEIRLSTAQRHDLGKLLFGFSTFWMYIGFSQYMLIWYANIAEEAAYFTRRLTPAWSPLMTATVLLMWIVPFVLLLPRSMKTSPGALAGAATVILAGHVLDLYVAIVPSFSLRPQFGGWELAALALTCAVTALALHDRSALRSIELPAGKQEVFEEELGRSA